MGLAPLGSSGGAALFPQQSSSFFSGGAAGPTYSYSSSSYMSNVNGVTYQESKTARAGPDGVSGVKQLRLTCQHSKHTCSDTGADTFTSYKVREMQRRVRDGQSGTETFTVARGLGDRARAVTRRKDASGRETSEDVLHGITNQDEASRYGTHEAGYACVSYSFSACSEL